MTQDEYRDVVITGLAARGVLRYNALCKQAMLRKQAGTLRNVGIGAAGGGASGAVLGALIQAARGKSVLKGMGVGAGIGTIGGAGAGYLAGKLGGPSRDAYGNVVDFDNTPKGQELVDSIDYYNRLCVNDPSTYETYSSYIKALKNEQQAAREEYNNKYNSGK